MMLFALGFCVGGGLTGMAALWLFDHTDWSDDTAR